MKTLALLLGATLGLVACSDDSSSATAQNDDTGVTAETAAPVDTGTSGDDAIAANDVAPDVAKPSTPEIVSVMPMAGDWHVTWKLNDTGLTKVELWRSNDGAPATLVRAFGGTAKDWHDGAASGTVVKYCYTVKTFRGELASDASPEKCSKS
jgi:hypothetical protein